MRHMEEIKILLQVDKDKKGISLPKPEEREIALNSRRWKRSGSRTWEGSRLQGEEQREERKR